MPSVAPNSLSAASASLYEIPSGWLAAGSATLNCSESSKISWPKNGSSWAARALLNAMASARVPPARGTPTRVAR